tara:strand:+ start:490 stop:1182 length:693 start_codon:yes stop_codon:yes gene_type:complete
MLSIITINFNNAEGLKRTLKSIKYLKSHSNLDIELIVIDGNSSDGSKNVIMENQEIIDRYLIEKDNGIYDAMNKGIKLANKKWLNFMNSGDTPINYSELHEVLECDDASVIYGDKTQSGELIKSGNLDLLFSGVIHACHQSMFFKRSLAIKYENYKVYGDYAYVLEHYSACKIFKYYPVALSDTEPGGVGQTEKWLKRKEKILILFRKLGFRGLCNGFLYSISRKIKHDS